MAQRAVNEKAISIRLACLIFSISETVIAIKPNSVIKTLKLLTGWFVWLITIETGALVCAIYICVTWRAFRWNHKRVYRIYRELELNLRIKPRKRLVRDKPQPLAVPNAMNVCWSWTLCMINWVTVAIIGFWISSDDFNREGLGIEVDLSLPAERVIRALDQIIEWRGKPSLNSLW